MNQKFRHCLWPVAIAVLIAIGGCTPELYGYKKVRDTDVYISDATRKEIVAQGLSREQVIERLGRPDGTTDDPRYISYTRCVRSTGWGVFGPGDVENCQRAVFRFDEAGRAYEQSSSIGKCTYGTCDWTTRD